ncbi:MAG: hypothetical protein RMI45_08835 [Ignisphaera sp.]|nr:hypothetical protein [Ignisphaera sp.]
MSREKKPLEIEVGEIKISRTPEEEYKISLPKKLSRDHLIQLYNAVQLLFDEEQKEILEEKRAKGLKTYVEYRGDEIVREY